MVFYCGLMQLTGQLETQAPQSMQTAGSITLLPFFSDIALTGQVPSQAPQLIQASALILCAINPSLSGYIYIITKIKVVPKQHRKCDATLLPRFQI